MTGDRSGLVPWPPWSFISLCDKELDLSAFVFCFSKWPSSNFRPHGPIAGIKWCVGSGPHSVRQEKTLSIRVLPGHQGPLSRAL